MKKVFKEYSETMIEVLSNRDWNDVRQLAESIRLTWSLGNQIFLCGNGGSAANATHLANDFLCGIAERGRPGARVEALSANPAVMTCLANDVGYEDIFSEQLKDKGQPEDILIVLSGSGNSPNIIKAITVANSLEMKTFAILGFSGGRCLELAHHVIHFPIQDMQISEDLQLITGHMCMQWLVASKVGGSLSEAKSQ